VHAKALAERDTWNVEKNGKNTKHLKLKKAKAGRTCETIQK